MTPKELTKLVASILNVDFISPSNQANLKAVEKELSAALEEAKKENDKWWKMQQSESTIRLIEEAKAAAYGEGYRKGIDLKIYKLHKEDLEAYVCGKKEAYLDAAKMVASSQGCGATFPNCDECDCHVEFSEKLRAKANEVGGTDVKAEEVGKQ